MNKDVQITITGIQQNGDESGEVTSVLQGVYYFKNNKHYILYDEYPLDTDKSVVNKNTLIINSEKNQIDLIKKGYQDSRLSFLDKEKFATSYKTPYGVFLMEINTTRIDILIDCNRIYTDTEYDLFMNDEFISHNHIKIEVISL